MDKLNLAWDTFDFHSKNNSELEEEYLSLLKKLKILLNKQIPATRWEKLDYVNKMTACCNKLTASYIKHIHCLDELIKIYKHRNLNGIPIPVEHITDIQFFNELKSINATLLEEIKVYQKSLPEILEE